MLTKIWWNEFTRSEPGRRLAFIYLLSDILHAFQRTKNPFIDEFAPLLKHIVDEIRDRCDADTQAKTTKTLKLWLKRNIFEPKLLLPLIGQSDADVSINNQQPLFKSLIKALEHDDNESLDDVLIAATAAPFLADPSLSGARHINAHRSRLEARLRRSQNLITLLTQRIAFEENILSKCAADLSACRDRLEADGDAPQSSKRPRHTVDYS